MLQSPVCDLPSVDRVDQRLVVTGVLVGVGLGEVGDRAVERVTVAKVERDAIRSPERAWARASVHPHILA